MNTKTLSEKAILMINQYKNVPYFNNKIKGRRAGLRVEIGKGSAKEIYDEVEQLALEKKIDLKTLDLKSTKRFMVEHNIGIDCSGFAYYILNEESKARGKGIIHKNFDFSDKSFFGKIRAKIMPEKNINVLTLTNHKNSRAVPLQEAEPGDIITMIGQRNHIMVVYKIEYKNNLPTVIYYVHAVVWPTDGEYGHGIHEGKIEIVDVEKDIIEQRWIENEKTGAENYTHKRAIDSITEVRRLNLFL